MCSRLPNVKHLSHATQNLSIRYDNKRILLLSPFFPRLRYQLEVIIRRNAPLHRRSRERRVQRPLLPRLGPEHGIRILIVPGVPGKRNVPGVREPCGAGPALEEPAGVRLGAVGLGDGLVDVAPPVEAGQLGVPDEGLVVCLAGRNDTTTPLLSDARHLPQDFHRLVHVLQYLVAENDVKFPVLEGQLVGVVLLKGEVVRDAALLRQRPRLAQHILYGVDSYD